MPATKLKIVEDLSEAAVPASTDLDGSVRGGRRFEQIGPSASCKLLEPLLENELPANISGLLVMDLSLSVGDLFWAWLERAKAMKCPVLYVAASADSTAVQWVHYAIQHELTEKLLSGKVTLPGSTLALGLVSGPALPAAQCLCPSTRHSDRAPSCCAAVGNQSDLRR